MPLVAFPVEKPPAEVQDVAFDASHESVDDCPELMVDGEAEKEMVGGDTTVIFSEQVCPNHSTPSCTILQAKGYVPAVVGAVKALLNTADDPGETETLPGRPTRPVPHVVLS